MKLMNYICNRLDNVSLDDFQTQYEVHIDDLQDYLFNTKDVTIYHAEAREVLAELGTLDCVQLVLDYAAATTGDVSYLLLGKASYDTLYNPCKLLNMVAYIIGDWLLGTSKTYCGHDEALTEEVVQQIIKDMNNTLLHVDSESRLFELVTEDYDGEHEYYVRRARKAGLL